MPHGHIRRSLNRGAAAAPISEVVRDRLGQDPLWRHFTVDGRWICPYCLAAVRAAQAAPAPGPSAASANAANMRRSIERHLTQRCPVFREGAGTPQTGAAIADRLRYEDISHLAFTDPAWQVFDHEGYWYSPSSLQRVTSVRIVNRRFDSFTVQGMVGHLMACPFFLAGQLHPVEAVQAARDQGIRIGKLARNIRKMLTYSIWRHADRQGCWVCPYCLAHVDTVIAPPGGAWETQAEAMAGHLLGGCSSFRPDRQELQPETAVAAAAGEALPATAAGTRRATAAPSTGSTRVRRSATGRTPVPATPASDHPAIPAAIPIDEMSEPPIARPMPRPPVTAHVLAPPVAKPVTRSPSAPAAASGPVAMPLEPEDADGLFGDAGQVIENSVVGQLADAEISETSRRDLAAISWLAEGAAAAVEGPADETPAPAPAAPAEDQDPSGEALTWMDDLDHLPGAEAAASQAGTGAGASSTDVIRARDLQKRMLRQCPSLPGYTFATRYDVCSTVSGDFYEFITLDDGRIGFAQGDVSGHGMQAGLIMTMAKKVLAIYARQSPSPRQVLSYVNDAIAEDLGGKMFISMTYGVLDPSARSITWSRAGHNPTLVHNVHSGELDELKPAGMVVGMKAGPRFLQLTEEVITPLRSGDLFLMYTDGVTETMNRQGEEYGVDRLKELLRQHAGLTVEQVLDRIQDSIRGFRGGGEPQDDVTLLALAVD